MKTATTTDRRLEAGAEAAVKGKRTAKRTAAESDRDSQRLGLLAQRYNDLREAGKRAFADADDVLNEILAGAPVGTRIQLPDGRTAVVEDNFMDKHGKPRNTAYKACGVSRFVLEIK